MANTHVISGHFWKRMVSPQNPWLWIVGAIFATVIGDTAFEVLSLEWWDLPRGWRLALRGTLFAIVVGLTVKGLPKILRRWPWGGKGAPQFESVDAVESPPAAIVFVSMNPKGPYRTALEKFLQRDHPNRRKLKSVYLVYSPESAQVADAFAEELRNEADLHVSMAGLEADFSVLESTYATTREAIVRAQERFDNSDIVIDVTGGSGIVSAGAVLAGMEHGIAMTYIKPIQGQSLEKGTLVAVDVSWREAGSERASHAGEEDSGT